MLVLSRNGEIGEDHRDDEDIVHRQRFLDDEAGQVFQRELLARLVPDPAAEGDADRDVEGGEHEALADSDFLGFFVQDAKVENEQEEDDGEKYGPHPEGLAEKVDEQHLDRSTLIRTHAEATLCGALA